MSGDTVLIPLAPLGVLELPRSVFEQYLRRPEALIGTPAPAEESMLVDARALAAALSLPKSCIYEYAKAKKIPCIRAGRHVRFDVAAVRRALDEVTVGHP